MIKGLKTLKDRWRSESPLIFKRITNICVTISAMAVAMLAAASVLRTPTNGAENRVALKTTGINLCC